MLDRFWSWATQVYLPYMVLIIAFFKMRRGGVGASALFQKIFELGSMACILGVALSAALLGSKENPVAWRIAGTVALALGALLIVIYVRVNDSHWDLVRKARLSIIMGTFFLGINTGILSSIHHPSEVMRPLVLGSMLWILPCIMACAIVRPVDAAK